ncbi:RNA polymerase sigma factor [Parapedobacter tibetensis]|uniref:RNA polymerase sigma factor n=1 Tax=Parapedobacter tibetensis TaxID=2972951 RepID=UPI00214DE9BF|nr:RNA polymerase sigma-70 factor [Parapedobacter tibetensis]
MAAYTSKSDLELATLLQADDEAAYAELYRRYALMLLNHAYNKTRDREEAKDIVHEVFSMLWSRRKALRFSSNLSGFLYTAVRNIILNQVTRREVEAKYFQSMQHFADTEESIADYLIREQQLAELVEREIEQLPKKMRQVFTLSRKEYLSHQEIAEKLGISEQTVSKHVTNALKILRGKLGILVYLLWLIKF